MTRTAPPQAPLVLASLSRGRGGGAVRRLSRRRRQMRASGSPDRRLRVPCHIRVTRHTRVSKSCAGPGPGPLVWLCCDALGAPSRLDAASRPGLVSASPPLRLSASPPLRVSRCRRSRRHPSRVGDCDSPLRGWRGQVFDGVYADTLIHMSQQPNPVHPRPSVAPPRPAPRTEQPSTWAPGHVPPHVLCRPSS